MDFYKNSEGYADPTAAEAINGMAKPGEIWTYNGKKALIVKNQGKYCNVLMLSEKRKVDCIEIAQYWAQPGMISYAFSSLLGECVGKLSEDEHDAVVGEIAAALQMPLIPKIIKNVADINLVYELVEKQKIVIREKEDEAQRLRGQVELLQNLYDTLLSKVIDKVGA